MRPSSALLATRAIPLASVPQGLLRLPPKPQPTTKASSTTSPTVERLLKSFVNKSARRPQSLGLDPSGRGLSSAVPEQVEQDLAAAEAQAGMDKVTLPANLRIEQFIPKRREYSGVKSGHRELLQRLRREA